MIFRLIIVIIKGFYFNYNDFIIFFIIFIIWEIVDWLD